MPEPEYECYNPACLATSPLPDPCEVCKEPDSDPWHVHLKVTV